MKTSFHRFTAFSSRYILATLLFFAVAGASAQELPKGILVSEPQPGVTSIAADNGNWGGDALGISHQNQDQYWTEKTLFIPAAALNGVREARLRIFMGLLDNSVNTPAIAPNGLSESFTITVNGTPHRIEDSDPALPSIAATYRWHDFVIPVEDLIAGKNVILIHKNHSETNDDYLYIGIDNTVSYGYSRMSQDGGKTWSTTDLNTINAHGEYMVQVLLLKESAQTFAVWTPQSTATQPLIGYAGIETDAATPYLNLELDSYELDPNRPLKVTIQTNDAAPTLRWLDRNNKVLPVQGIFEQGVWTTTFPPARESPARLEIDAGADGKLAVSQVRFDYSRPVGADIRRRVDMAPLISTAKGKPTLRAPQANLTPDGFVMQNATQIATFATKPALRLVSLRNEYLQKNVLAHPEQTHLFLIEADGKRFGAEDWRVQQIKQVSPTSIQVSLMLPSPALTAQLTVSIDSQMLKFGLEVVNASKGDLTWKTAFPQIGGLQLSPDANEDNYLFPMWGGVIASQNVNFRTFYGDDSSWWQMVTLFSPKGGAGLSIRGLDETGLFKGIAMRKGQTPAEGSNFLRGINYAGMVLDMGWKDSLQGGPGTTMNFEYLKYTRAPGKSFKAPDAAVEMFSGDWHSAMKTYADWAHKTWKWRPWSSKVRDRWNIDSPGWGLKPLFANGKWRTDYINKKSDVAEIMSWWQWSKKGPWQVPMDQIKEKLGESIYNAYINYWVINPATGEREYPLNRGDYEYNTDWGGLPALRKQLQAIRDGGQQPWFYHDPFLADDNTVLGHKYGPDYAIVKKDWTDMLKVPLNPPGYVTDYASWNMCMDTAWYHDFLLDQTTRIVRDTGVDGLRYDQMGLNGYACDNPRHTHVFAEPGECAGLRAATLICRRVHESIDKFKPDFVLTTEFLGYDRLAATLEGSVNYESARHVFPGFRPVPLNIFRFYFPEHKHFDLDDLGTPGGQEWRFWNATGTFNSLYPPKYFLILRENSDTFDTREASPLVPTLKQGIYANRFTGGGKTITMLYNARGFTVDAPLIAAPTKAGFHYFDMLRGLGVVPQNNAISMKLRPGQVGSIALLPQILSVQKTAAGWQLKLNRKVANAMVKLCDANGEELQKLSVTGQEALLPELKDGKAVYIKLFSGDFLVDAQTLDPKL